MMLATSKRIGPFEGLARLMVELTFVPLPISLPRTGSISLPPIPQNPSNPITIDIPSIRGLEA